MKMDTEEKLNMSLEDITSSSKSSKNSGKVSTQKRFQRRENSSPYAKPGVSVYVGNLPYKISWQDLKDHMATAGSVEHVSILMQNPGWSKGCAVVKYRTVRDAKNAIDTLNNSSIEGREIFVREDREATKSTSAEYEHAHCRVYVGNLSFQCTWQNLKDHMKQVGNVLHADVMQYEDGRSKGYGLVEFTTAEEAQDAIKMLNDTELLGRVMFVREDREAGVGSISSLAKGNVKGKYRERPRTDNEAGVELLVGNLPYSTTWQELKDHFKPCGFVEHVDILQNIHGKPKGEGVVRFSKEEDAEDAINQLNGKNLDGRPISVRLHNEH